MTTLLAIDTSAEACSIALFRDGDTLSFFEHAPMRHAELLLPAVQSLLNEAGMILEDMEAIAFGQGPGSFTSLRIGIGVVQGLAWGAGLPVIPVSSLAALAQAAVNEAAPGYSSICVAVDARMQEVYTANFRCGSEGIVALEGVERVCEPGLAGALPGGPYLAAGNGFERFSQLDGLAQGAIQCLPEIRPQAEQVCTLALDWLKDNEPLPAGMAQPMYIRNNVAVKPGSN